MLRSKRPLKIVGYALAASLMLCANSGCTATGKIYNDPSASPSGDRPSPAGELTRPKLTQFVSGSAQIDPAVLEAIYNLGGEQVRGEDSENAVASPVGTTVGFAQVGVGAAGQTRQQIEQALRASGDDLLNQYGQVWAVWEQWDGSPDVVKGDELPANPVVSTSARVAVADNFEPREEYVGALAENFGVSADRVDFASPQGKADLDRWANEHTGGLVKESKIQPDGGTAMVLQNATVLAAAWAEPFNPLDTEPNDFTTGSGQKVQVDSMFLSSHLPYAEGSNWEATRLDYANSTLAAYIVMPPAGTELSGKDLLSAVQGVERGSGKKMLLWLPKVDTSSTTDLRPVLRQCGGEDVFGSSADLSGINADAPLAVGQAVQQTVLQMDEAGTKAAALTEIEIEVMAAPVEDEPIHFMVDRPYYVVIADRQSQLPLFLARISNPQA